jgi:N6-adenosine-specific RNA methylase IME4
MGYTRRKNAELCLLARRGSPKRLRKDIHELIIAPRREHSRQPVEARTRIEQYADGPQLEMFAREPAVGLGKRHRQIRPIRVRDGAPETHGRIVIKSPHSWKRIYPFGALIRDRPVPI